MFESQEGVMDIYIDQEIARTLLERWWLRRKQRE